MSNPTVVLFVTHFLSPGVVAAYHRLDDQLGDRYDVRLFYDNTRNDYDTSLPGAPASPSYFTRDTLFDAAYPRKGATGRVHPGNGDLLWLRFFREHEPFDYYWLVEHDVRFSGNWRTLFDAHEASSADLLGTTLCRHATTPNWLFWDSIEAPPGVGLDSGRLIRGFFPIVRLSRRALTVLDGAYRQGWTGHAEGAVPTILSVNDLSLEDLGGCGEFVKPEHHGLFYRNTVNDDLLSPGTLVFRPTRDDVGDTPDQLWHPVKKRSDPTWTFRRWRDAPSRVWSWRRRRARHQPPAKPPDE